MHKIFELLPLYLGWSHGRITEEDWQTCFQYSLRYPLISLNVSIYILTIYRWYKIRSWGVSLSNSAPLMSLLFLRNLIIMSKDNRSKTSQNCLPSFYNVQKIIWVEWLLTYIKNWLRKNWLKKYFIFDKNSVWYIFPWFLEISKMVALFSFLPILMFLTITGR